MRIIVFGATGMAGSEIVTEALRRGHRVIAASRTPRHDDQRERLTHMSIDVADASTIAELLPGADAAVFTVRLPPGRERDIAPLTDRFLHAARAAATPVLIVGGAAPLRSPSHPNVHLIDDRTFVPEAWLPIARASMEQFVTCAEHPNQHWTYLSPPAVLEPGHRTGGYRRGQDALLTDPDGTSHISAADLAIAVCDELENPSGDQHFTVIGAR